MQLLEAGVRCVLGTDGPGLYGTTPSDELRAARLAGVNDAHLHTLRETERQYLERDLEAAIRELNEEAALDVSALRARFQLIAQVEGGGRDERDSPAAWSRTWLFRVTLDEHRAVAGGDDAADARWFPVEALPSRLAFDHAKLLALALESR